MNGLFIILQFIRES